MPRISVFSLLVVLTTVTNGFAQEDLLGELYGIGVHAYNSGDYRDAYENLSAAVEGGTRDPRAFYFRGLALAQLGRPEDARLDFAKGAQLEVAGGGDRYPIGRALERVQGAQRMTIERVRQIEKIKYQQAQLADSKRRYEDQKRIQAQEPVLKPVTPADIAPPVGVVDDGVVPASMEGDPFKDDGGLGVGAVEAAPERPSAGSSDKPVPGSDDPFGAGPMDEEPAPVGDDPFGGAPAADEPIPAGEDPFGADEPEADEPARAEGDLFGAPRGGDEPAGDDPFGDAPGDEGAEEPAMEEPAGGDPFGAGPAADDAKPAAPVGGKPFDTAPPTGNKEGGAVTDVIRGVGAAIGEVEAGAADQRDPFDDEAEPKPAAGGAKPTAKADDDPFGTPAAGDANKDPFGDDPAAAAPPAGDDPFAN